MADERLLRAASDGDIKSLQELLTAGECDINVQDWNGCTPLHWAALCGHTQCVQLLLQHGADTSIQYQDGGTPLHWAALLGNTQCVQLLLQHGADTSIQDKNGWTPLHCAANQGHTQCVQLLLQHGADTSIQAKNGWTPLQGAARRGRTQCVQLLLQHGADTNIQAEDGWTTLHGAAKSGNTQCIQLLLQHGADTSIQDKDGRTSLHLAAYCGQTQCVQLLLQHGADTNIQDKYGWTALHQAARYGDTQCIQLLLQHGADASIQDQGRKTPRMVAEDEKQAAVAKLLRRFEIPDIQGYVQTRTLERLAELLNPAEYTIINQTNLSTNFPGVLQFQKVQELKDWAKKNNYTNIRDLRVGLQATNLPRLSSAAVDFYAEVVKNISDMPPGDYKELCRTLITARHMCITCSATTNQQEINSSMEPLRYDAFIAHSSEDKAVVEAVIEQLEELGVQCCYGVRDFHPGRSVVTSMGEAVYGSKRTCVPVQELYGEPVVCKGKGACHAQSCGIKGRCCYSGPYGYPSRANPR